MEATRLTLVLLLAAVPGTAASLVHDYTFQGTLADSLGGPSLTSLGGAIGPSDYTFSAEQGLSLSGALTTAQSSNYTIYLDFEFDSLTGFRKILDFKDLASDDGLYDLNTALNYFNFVTGSTGAFSPGTFAQVVLTRDSTTGVVTGYVNGVQQIQFTDTTSDAVFNATNNIINFFQDDNVTGGRESSSGAVSEIRIYDGALTATEVAALSTQAVPEPAALMLVGGALLLCGLHRRKSPR